MTVTQKSRPDKIVLLKGNVMKCILENRNLLTEMW